MNNGWNKSSEGLPCESKLVEFYAPFLGTWSGRFLGYLSYEEHNDFKPAFISLDVENIPDVEYWRYAVEGPNA